MLSNLFQLTIYDRAVQINRAQALTLPEQNIRIGIPFAWNEITAL
jgi:hypothetical protein